MCFVCVLRSFSLKVYFSFSPQAKSIAEPFAYDEYRKAKIKKKIEEARATRIRLKVKNMSWMCREWLCWVTVKMV